MTKRTVLAAEQLVKAIQESPEQKALDAYRGSTLSVVNRQKLGGFPPPEDVNTA